MPVKKKVVKESPGHKTIKKKLVEMREELLSGISSSVRTERDTLKSELGDLYDQASNERERELNLLLCEKDRRRLAEIDQALSRVERGEYGICESCGEKISKGRLLAMPFTLLCISCKAEEEKLKTLESQYEEEGTLRDVVFTEEDET